MDPLTGSILNRFAGYVFPTIFGMLAISSAGIIDGIFLGNYVGPDAIAAVNISLPVFSLTMGIALMLSVGGSVVAGNLLGRGKIHEAGEIFSHTMVANGAIGLAFLIIAFPFLPELIRLLGANHELEGLTLEYLHIIIVSIPFYMLGFGLYYFVRLDGHPQVASYAMLASALTNIVLDWLLIARMGFGIQGAAFATSISYFVLLLVLVPHFFSAKARLSLCFPSGQWMSTIKASANGLSEFVNELSIGATTLLFNWVMVTRFGADGVAAFAIVNYIVWIAMMILFGISDSLPPLISHNFGAGKMDRVRHFFHAGMAAAFIVGLIVIGALLIFPHQLIDIFLSESADNTQSIALTFVSYYWPAFLFNGMAICISAYLTAMLKPLPSAVIAITRSFILPALLVLLLPTVMGDVGVFTAVPVAEAITFVMACLFFWRFAPAKLMRD